MPHFRFPTNNVLAHCCFCCLEFDILSVPTQSAQTSKSEPHIHKSWACWRGYFGLVAQKIKIASERAHSWMKNENTSAYNTNIFWRISTSSTNVHTHAGDWRVEHTASSKCLQYDLVPLDTPIAKNKCTMNLGTCHSGCKGHKTQIQVPTL